MPAEQDLERVVAALERIALVLAAIHAESLDTLDQGDKAKRLHNIGFSNVQIADALGTTSNSINVALHKARHRTKPGRASKKRRGTA